jgi:hypothetical protein
MAHFAQVENGIVTQVIVAEQDVIDSGLFGSGWVQTSYNTRGGVHYGQDGQPDGGVALRKNYAGIGYSYDSVRDAFIPPQPYPSWTLNEDTCDWVPPTPYPTDGKLYSWDEATQSWVETTQSWVEVNAN